MHLGGLHIKLNSHPFRSKLPRQDCHGSKSIDRFDSLKAFLGGLPRGSWRSCWGMLGSSIPPQERRETEDRGETLRTSSRPFGETRFHARPPKKWRDSERKHNDCHNDCQSHCVKFRDGHSFFLNCHYCLCQSTVFWWRPFLFASFPEAVAYDADDSIRALYNELIV